MKRAHPLLVRCLLSLAVLVDAGAVRAGNLTVDGALISTTPSGPPLEVESSSKVENLNADLLDGLDSSAFVPATNLREHMSFVSCLSPLTLAPVQATPTIPVDFVLPLYSFSSGGGVPDLRWDTHLVILSFAGETTLYLYLYDALGATLQSATTEDVCNPCTWVLGGSGNPHQLNESIGSLIESAGGPQQAVSEGYGLLIADGAGEEFLTATAFLRYGAASSSFCPGAL